MSKPTRRFKEENNGCLRYARGVRDANNWLVVKQMFVRDTQLNGNQENQEKFDYALDLHLSYKASDEIGAGGLLSVTESISGASRAPRFE